MTRIVEGFTSKAHRDMYNFLCEVQEKYCNDENSSVDFGWFIDHLYYIVNPDKLVDDAKIESEEK